MFIAEHFALPATQSHLLIHSFWRKDETLLHSTPHMKWTRAALEVALNTLSLSFVAYVTSELKLVKIELAPEIF